MAVKRARKGAEDELQNEIRILTDVTNRAWVERVFNPILFYDVETEVYHCTQWYEKTLRNWGNSWTQSVVLERLLPIQAVHIFFF